MEAGGKNASSALFQLPFVMGTPDMDSAMEKVKQFRLAGVAEKIECPTLIVHGLHDTIVPVEWAQQALCGGGLDEEVVEGLHPYRRRLRSIATATIGWLA